MMTLDDFRAARRVLDGVLHRTDLMYSPFFTRTTGNQVYIKPENMQVTGAYKIRGAYFKCSTLTEEEKARQEKQAEDAKPVLDFVKETLGDRIKEARVSKILKTAPVCMTADGPMSLEMEKYFSKLEGSSPMGAMKAERVLELNPSSAAYGALKGALEGEDKARAAKYVEVLYHQALLIAGLPIEDPAAYTELVCSLMQ